MVNLYLEIERLKSTLRNRGLEEEHVQIIASKAMDEIAAALQKKIDDAMELAVQSGVQKDSPEFINDLRPRFDAFIIDTSSGSTDFSDPPYPMLDRLLAKNAKPLKDGSGVYKVIPIGQSGNNIKPKIHSNIFDAQRAISAERYENAISQYNKIAPKDSKVTFRTATSKQNRATQWVQPEKVKDFTDDLAQINSMLIEEHDTIILDIIRSYEENF